MACSAAGPPASTRDAVLERVRNGRLQVRVAAHNSTVWLSGPGATE